MPIRNPIRTLGASPQPLAEARLPSERALEAMIVAAPLSPCSMKSTPHCPP